MFGLKKEMKEIALEKEVDRLLGQLNHFKAIAAAYEKDNQVLYARLRCKTPPQPTITLKDNNFPKAVLANLVAMHGIDSNDCKNHQRDRENVMSGIINAVACGGNKLSFAGRLNAYVIAELIEAGYELEYDDRGTVVKWGNAYLTPQS